MQKERPSARPHRQNRRDQLLNRLGHDFSRPKMRALCKVLGAVDEAGGVVGQEERVDAVPGPGGVAHRHPDQLQAWRADPALARTAVDELLRWDSPVQLNIRAVLEPAPTRADLPPAP